MNESRNGYHIYLKNITTQQIYSSGYVEVKYRGRVLGFFQETSIKEGFLEVHVLAGEQSPRNRGESLIDVPNNRNGNQQGVPVKTKDLMWDN